MLFTLNRDKHVSGTTGHTIEFLKGVPTYVPREMHSTVLGIGAVPAEELVEDEVTRNEIPTEQVDRDAAILKAIKELVLRNAREDFGANGAPTLPAVAMYTKFAITKKERDSIWTKFRQGEEE